MPSRLRRPIPRRLRESKILHTNIKITPKISVRSLKAGDEILIKRHNAPDVIGFHDGHNLKLTHQLNRDGTHFKVFTTNVAGRESEARMQKNIVNMDFKPNGTLKFPNVVKSIHKLK